MMIRMLDWTTTYTNNTWFVCSTFISIPKSINIIVFIFKSTIYYTECIGRL